MDLIYKEGKENSDIKSVFENGDLKDTKTIKQSCCLPCLILFYFFVLCVPSRFGGKSKRKLKP